MKKYILIFAASNKTNKLNRVRHTITTVKIMRTLNELRALYREGKMQDLTLKKAMELKGKRIKTIAFGYAGQDVIDNFVVGDIVSEYDYYKFIAKEDCFPNEKGHQNRAEYWESYMTPERLTAVKNNLMLLRKDNTLTYISLGYNGETFSCGDLDRFVSFIEVQ